MGAVAWAEAWPRSGRGWSAPGAPRLAATLVVLGASTGFILLMLALASQLSVLENDPGALGKRYQLTAALGADDVAQVQALPGVAAAVAGPRSSVHLL